MTIVFSQKNNIAYYPLEQIVHPDCKDTEHPNACIESLIRTRIAEVLNRKESLHWIQQYPKDTLNASLNLRVHKSGKVDTETSYAMFYTTEKAFRDHFSDTRDSLENIIHTLPVLEVLNKKSEKYRVIHSFSFSFLIHRSKDTLFLNLLNKEKPYEGGFLEEMPRFKACKEKISDKESRMCFQTEMNNHIMKNFKYPKKAMKRGIEGKVYIMFTIGKDGTIKRLRTRGPHMFLEEEARRIVNRLPRFIPGKRNGVPVNVPFSLPINFKLQ